MPPAVPKVPVGVATKAGYSVSLTAFALAVAAYLTGDHSQQTVGTVVAGAVGLITLAITQVGRYAQAHAIVSAVAKRPAPAAQLLSSTSSHVSPAAWQVTASSPTDPPGDPDALPHLPVTDPADIDPDLGDGGAVS